MDLFCLKHHPPAPCPSLHIPIQVRDTSQKKEDRNFFQQQTKDIKIVGNMDRVVHSVFRCGVCFTD